MKLVSRRVPFVNTTGSKLADSDFSDSGDGPLPAFESWKRSLEKKKLLAGLPGDLETPLWRFWNGGRPMRQEDYRKGDYYDCTRCKGFTSFARGRLVKTMDPVVGAHYAFVCKKH